MKFNSQRRNLLAVFGFASLLTTTASAALIDVDFSPGAGPAQSGAAVLGSAGDIWNNLTAGSGTSVPLNDTTGAASGVSLTFSEAFGGNNTAGSAMDAATTSLMQDFGSFNGTTLAITGLLPSTAYQLALYGAGSAGDAGGTPTTLNGAANGGQGTTFTIPQSPNPSVVGKTTEVNPTTPTLGDRKISDGAGVAYVLLNANSDASGNLNINVTFNSTSFSTAPVNGFQIQAVPEPGSLALVGAVSMLGLRRRRA